MSDAPDGLRPESLARYAGNTHASPNRLVRYAHQKRFAEAARYVERSGARTVLDYGAGDGQFLAGLSGGDFDRLVASEPIEGFRDLAREKFGADSKYEVVANPSKTVGQFDAICCLSVLEHLPLSERLAFYDVCSERLAPGGTIVLEVPVEIGVSLLVKEVGRAAIKRRPMEYAPRELLKATAGVCGADPDRYGADGPAYLSSHRGFDYRQLRDEAAGRFDVVAQSSTPWGLMPAWAGNQERFLVLQAR